MIKLKIAIFNCTFSKAEKTFLMSKIGAVFVILQRNMSLRVTCATAVIMNEFNQVKNRLTKKNSTFFVNRVRYDEKAQYFTHE